MPDPLPAPSNAERLGTLTTESVSAERSDLDVWPTRRLAEAMNAEDMLVPVAVSRQLGAISAAIDAIAVRIRAGGRLIYVGAGTPGRIGIVDASEAPPTFGTDPAEVVAVIAGGESAVFTSVENAEDDAASGRADLLAQGLTAADCVVGVSASGRTPYVAGALSFARETGALTVAVANNEGSTIGDIADHRIEVVVGPEFVSGSTRLKAGTAQKLVLNMISTIVMVKLGKTYGSLMVDLRATNHKLRVRAESTVMRIAGVDAVAARGALQATDYAVKEAVLVLASGGSPDDARTLLAAHGGSFRAALDAARS